MNVATFAIFRIMSLLISGALYAFLVSRSRRRWKE